jgi:homoserine kinase
VAEASAPASAANLGPGFDVLALALDLRCHVNATPARAWSIEHRGVELPAGNDIVMAAARRAVGDDRPLALTVNSEIPVARGLGSSAAAAAAAAAAAWRAVGGDSNASHRRVFELVADMEQHPDNAAAAVYGGLVLCTPDGEVQRLPLLPGLVPIVAVPTQPLPTTQARLLLPDQVSRDAAVRSLGRVAALVAGLIIGDDVLLAAARGDEMHEEPRNRFHPEVSTLIEAARGAGAVHACWSGAGPSVLALAAADTVAKVKAALEAHLDSGVVLEPAVALTGLI